MHWCHEQLNWREKYGERAFPGNETVSETWFLPPILVAQCQTEIGEKAKIETPQNNAAVVILDQMVASNCFEKLWLSLLSKKSVREVPNSPDSCWKGKYSISETILSGRLKCWRLHEECFECFQNCDLKIHYSNTTFSCLNTGLPDPDSSVQCPQVPLILSPLPYFPLI